MNILNWQEIGNICLMMTSQSKRNINKLCPVYFELETYNGYRGFEKIKPENAENGPKSDFFGFFLLAPLALDEEALQIFPVTINYRFF